MSVNTSIVDFIEERTSEEYRINPFYLFEPFSVGERSPQQLAQMHKDHVDLYSPETVRAIGKDPHPFQDGYCLDTAFLTVLLAGTQTGKSYCAYIDMIIQLTGEIPYSLRFAEGEKTGIKRVVDKANIQRFGRFDKQTGEFLDKNVNAIQDTSWDCGEVEGVGIYPKSKIAPVGSKIWLCTFKQAREEYWWPRLKLIPEHLIDKRKGNKGFYSSDEYIVYLNRGCEIHIITYEQGYERVEADKVHRIHLDEEPPDERFFVSSITHCHSLSMTMTPYRGITFTHDKIFKQAGSADAVHIYHCTQYDSPYHTIETINRARKYMDSWTVGARVYGLHSEQVGKPYYDRILITEKLRGEYIFRWKRTNLLPTRHWNKIGDLFTDEILSVEDEDGAWEIYEEPDKECSYWIGVDTAEGSENPEEAADKNCAHIFRLPKEGDPAHPIHVASLYSGIQTTEFARLVLYGAMYYNNALIAPEAMGFTAGTFLAELRDYPFMFSMSVVNDKTKKPTNKIGFTTSNKTRTIIFDLVGNWIKEYEKEKHFGINHFKTLKEIAACVVGRGGRPDHPRGGTTDGIFAFGIGLYVYSTSREQIQNRVSFNKSKKELDIWGDRVYNVKETRPILGSRRGLDERSKQRN